MPDTRSTLTPAGHPGLMADILAHPRDVAPRLVYADWLEDQGQEDRAAFVREPFGAGRPYAPKQSRDYQRRMGYVREGLAGVFSPACRLWFCFPDNEGLRKGVPLAEVTAGWCWTAYLSETGLVVRHGFVSDLSLTERRFFGSAAALFRAQPVADVRLILFAGDGPERPGVPFQSSTAWFARKAGRRKLGAVDRRLFDLLRGGERFRDGPHEGVNYPDKVSAWRALSDACVTWGRRAAGLPDLPPTAPECGGTKS